MIEGIRKIATLNSNYTANTTCNYHFPRQLKVKWVMDEKFQGRELLHRERCYKSLLRKISYNISNNLIMIMI